ncbi:MAG: beta-xylosidase [Devosia sp.]|nr:beta-xylosidase [Devosia sp.]
MPLVANPILPGFNPDPSILRVDNDYYIATSTFEWYRACRSITAGTWRTGRC